MRVARLSPGREALAWTVIAATSLWLKTGFPSDAIGNAMHDDALFVHQARLLALGHWLGPYNNLTLAKGMMFPLFIAAAQLAAIPLTLAEQLAWLAAAALTAWLVRQRSGEPWLAFALFAALAFNPIVWDVQLARVVREGLYLSLSLAAMALLVPVAFPADRSRATALAWGGGFGLAAGAFWLTREEGPWLLPAFLVVLAAAAPGVARRGGRLVPAALGLGAAALVFGLALGAVSTLNWRRYGAFITNEFRSEPFRHAYGALARIRHDRWVRFVVFPKDARERAYRVSPAARELAPVLDGPLGEAWRGVGCGALQRTDCPEVLSGWFMWELRDAVAQAGHYGSGAEAMRFYDRLAREIDAACDAGDIPCGPARATFAPVFRWHYLKDTWRKLPLVADITLRLATPNLGSLPSEGPRLGVADFADAVGEVSAPPGLAWFVRGWVASPAGRPAILVRPRGDAPATVAVSDDPAPDVAAILPGWTAQRFDLMASCAGCDLVATGPGAAEIVLPLDAVHAGQTEATPTLRLAIDAADLREPEPLTARRRAVQRDIARAIGAGYAEAAPALCCVAVAGVVLGLARRRRLPAALLALTLASAAAVAARMLLLAYLDVTSIPSARVLYTSAATPFVIVFAVLGCWCGVRAVWPR